MSGLTPVHYFDAQEIGFLARGAESERTSRWVEGYKEPPAVPTPSGGSFYVRLKYITCIALLHAPGLAHRIMNTIRYVPHMRLALQASI